MTSVLGQLILVVLCVVYAMAVVMFTSRVYRFLLDKGFDPRVSIYYTRKIVHMAAGGLVALLVPHIFRSPVYPLLVGLLLTFFTYIPHRTGQRLDWLQTSDNKNDVKFTAMWGLSIFLIWLILKDPYPAIIPAVFMAFGDGMTGVVRNAFFKRRTKSWIGNLAMVLVCIPLGYWLGSAAAHPIPGWAVFAAIVASIIEHFEFGAIDDNILITLATTIILLFGSLVS
jgi:phytol kinase